jgi:hypothetical protein
MNNKKGGMVLKATGLLLGLDFASLLSTGCPGPSCNLADDFKFDVICIYISVLDKYIT